MISDAALAMRMQELQEEQALDFAAVLGGFDNAEVDADAAYEAAVQQPEQEIAVSEGIACDDDKTAGESADKTVVSKSDKDSEKPVQERDVAAEQLQAVVVTPVDISEEITAEFEELAAAVAETVGTVEAVEEITEAMPNIQQAADITPETVLSAENDAPEESAAESSVAETAIVEKFGTDSSEADVDTVRIELSDIVQETVAAEADTVPKATDDKEMSEDRIVKTRSVSNESVYSPTGSPAQTSVRAVAAATNVNTESGNDRGTNTGESPEGFGEELTRALEQAAENGEISKPEIRTVTRAVSEQPEQPEQQTVQTEQSEQTTANVQSTVQSRVKSVTEELEMLKSAKAKPVESEEQSELPKQTEQPLQTDTPIVLTRSNGERLEVRPSEVIEQTTAKLVETAETMTEQQTEYSMVLNPEELGQIVVKLVKAADGAVSVTIAAENSRTQHILEQNSAAMQESLRSSGVRLEGWQMVQESRQETYAQDYNGSSKNPYYREDNPSRADNDGEETSFAELIASM